MKLSKETRHVAKVYFNEVDTEVLECYQKVIAEILQERTKK